MKDRIRDFLPYCEKIDFGKVKLSETETTFYRRFNNEIFSFCRSLPESVRTDSMLFLMRYSGLNLADELDFFANYYSPTWSILYWLSRNRSLPARRLKKEDIASAITAQSMAMLLHSLDDHLTDSQISVSPLTLLLRSQAWMVMNRAFCNLAEGLPVGERTVRRFMDDYYSSIPDSNELKSFDSYCHLFRKQMAIGMAAPILLCMKINRKSNFTRDIEMAYGSFGIAWRLLDDIRDISRDMEKGAHSAIYLCLPKKMRTYWNSHNSKKRAAAKDSINAILSYILENCLIERIMERICAELETAASIVEGYGLKGLSKELNCLTNPLRKSSST